MVYSSMVAWQSDGMRGGVSYNNGGAYGGLGTEKSTAARDSCGWGQ
jgi:hypothetical protein